MQNQKLVMAALVCLVLFSVSLNLWQLVSLRQIKRGPASLNEGLLEGISLQKKTLCDVAKEHLREYWQDQRKNIEKVIQVVNNDNEMQGKLKLDLVQMSEALDLTDSEIEQIRPKYEQIFQQHVGTFKSELNQKDPNWSGMFQTLKEFYVAEDQLITKLFGDEGLRKFRENQAKKRTTMLALIGQYANIDWDNSITW